MAKKIDAPKETAAPKKRRYLSQEDVPGSSLENALRVPRAISENYAGGPVTPLQLAAALNMSPSSGPFRALCGASIAYGLTSGGYNAQQILLQPLGKRIVKPLEEGDDVLAKREAILKPRVVGEFLTKYSGSPLPRHDIALNVLQEMGVPGDKAESVFSLIVDSAQTVGLLREIKGKQYVDLTGVSQPPVSGDASGGSDDDVKGDTEEEEEKSQTRTVTASTLTVQSPQLSRRVFITHGKDKSFLDPIKKLLGFGEMTPVISVERQSVSKPVPDKVMEDMRSCSAAIIHVDAERTLIDKDATEHKILNPNVLIEIGAAMALYGRRFILLVRDGVELPSNLQGLYEVRYKGDSLDGEATIKLLEAINDIKNNPLPERYRADA
ncbi:MAG: TIR domain-containing protein [Pseudomonadota bacterium]